MEEMSLLKWAVLLKASLLQTESEQSMYMMRMLLSSRPVQDMLLLSLPKNLPFVQFLRTAVSTPLMRIWRFLLRWSLIRM